MRHPTTSLRVPLPLGGLNQNEAFSEQPPRTSRDVKNMRGVDPSNGRRRLAQRSGVSKYNSNQINSSNKIQALGQITFEDRRLTYTADSAPDSSDKLWETAVPSKEDTYGARVSARTGDIYVTDGRSFSVLNTAGTVLATYTVPLDDNGFSLRLIELDPSDNVYLAVYSGGTAPSSERVLYKYALQIDGTYEIDWTLTLSEYVAAMKYRNGSLYVATTDRAATPTATLRRYTDLDSATPSEENATIPPATGAADILPMDLDVNDDGEIFVAGRDLTTDEQLVKIDIDGTLIASLRRTAAANAGGIGWGVALGVTDQTIVYTMGDAQGGSQWASILSDDGSSFSEDTALTTPLSVSFSTLYGEMLAVDTFDNVHYMIPTTTGLYDEYRVYESDGTLLLSVDMQTVTTEPGFGLAIPPTVPVYNDDTITQHEHTYVVGNADGTTGVSVFKLQLVTSALQAVGSPRQTTKFAVSGGTIKTFADSGTPATPTGGSSALDSTGQFITWTPHRQRVYFTDGLTDLYYDPIEDEVISWVSTTSGELPPRCKLLATWRDRVIRARDGDNPDEWFMSAVGDAGNYNFFPPVLTPSMAIAGNNSQAGRCPDIINALVPYSDDLLFFGGDKSIYRMTGDPAAGGQFDLVSDETGMAFGKSWTKDPNGMLYFAGSRGGVFRMAPGSVPEEITRDTVDTEFRSFDLTTYFLRLHWNDMDDGLHVFQMPYGAGGTVVSHYFWERRTGAWWKDQFGATDVQPTAAFMFDGDAAADRVLLIGCEDGYVRKWDADATDDDGNKIDSYVVLGPFGAQGTGRSVRLSKFQAGLGDSLSGAGYEWFGSRSPDSIGSRLVSGPLYPGLNGWRHERVTAPYVWARLRNSDSNTWALESLECELVQAGRTR